MTQERNALGAYGERVAATHLAKAGLELLDRNWRCSEGELDLVLREGDTLVVTRLDRLARSGRDLHDILAQLSAKQVGFRCVQQGAVDTTTSMGKVILGILGAVAEFETDIRKERQREGIERAKAARVYKGRKPTVDVAQVRSLRDQGLGATDIATKLRIARASVYRALKDDPVTAT